MVTDVPKDTDRLREEIAAIFADQMNIEVASADTDLIEEGLLDSLAFMDLLMFLEQRFGIVFTPDQLDFDNFRSLNRIARTISGQSGLAED